MMTKSDAMHQARFLRLEIEHIRDYGTEQERAGARDLLARLGSFWMTELHFGQGRSFDLEAFIAECGARVEWDYHRTCGEFPVVVLEPKSEGE